MGIDNPLKIVQNSGVHNNSERKTTRLLPLGCNSQSRGAFLVLSQSYQFYLKQHCKSQVLSELKSVEIELCDRTVFFAQNLDLLSVACFWLKKILPYLDYTALFAKFMNQNPMGPSCQTGYKQILFLKKSPFQIPLFSVKPVVFSLCLDTEKATENKQADL